jgi:prepilin-type N-terminal cleavage/methylation domain-containing protein
MEHQVTSKHKNRKGFSLAEAMMATVVLAIAAAGVLLPFTSGARLRAQGMRRTLAGKLASDLMEQIVNTPFDQIVAAYDGYSEPQGQVKDAAGTTFTDSNYANLSRQASCEYVYMPQESGATEPKFIRAAVRVYYRGSLLADISRLISQ